MLKGNQLNEVKAYGKDLLWKRGGKNLPRARGKNLTCFYLFILLQASLLWWTGSMGSTPTWPIFRLDKPNLKVKQVNMNSFVGVHSSGQVRSYLNVGQCTSQALACETDQFVNRAQQAHFDGPKDMIHWIWAYGWTDRLSSFLAFAYNCMLIQTPVWSLDFTNYLWSFW